MRAIDMGKNVAKKVETSYSQHGQDAGGWLKLWEELLSPPKE